MCASVSVPAGDAIYKAVFKDIEFEFPFTELHVFPFC